MITFRLFYIFIFCYYTIIATITAIILIFPYFSILIYLYHSLLYCYYYPNYYRHSKGETEFQNNSSYGKRL